MAPVNSIDIAEAPACVLLFSGYNNRALLSFMRTLEEYSVEYAVIARNDQDQIFHTHYRDRVIYTRTSASLDLKLLEDCLGLARSKFGGRRVLIAPSTEALNRFLLQQRESLAAMHALVPLADKTCYESISDKAAFTALCRAGGLLVPAEYSVLERALLPFVAKPKEYTGKNGKTHSPVLVFSEAQRRAFAAEHESGDFYFQEYVEGRSIYLLYYFGKNGHVYSYSQENLVQQPEGKSIVAARSARYHEQPISSEYEALFIELGFSGLVMVELRENACGQYMIEANPRFWGPSQLFVDAGVNFFAYLLQDYGLCKPQAHEFVKGEATYLWFGGIFETLKNSGELSFMNCTPESFYADFDIWMSHDVYKRSDSLDVFTMELK